MSTYPIHDRLVSLTQPGEVLRVVVWRPRYGKLEIVIERQSDARAQRVRAWDESVEELLQRIEDGEGDV